MKMFKYLYKNKNKFLKGLKIFNVCLFWTGAIGLGIYTIFIDFQLHNALISTIVTSGSLKATLQFFDHT